MNWFDTYPIYGKVILLSKLDRFNKVEGLLIMLDKSMEIAIDESYEMREAIKAQAKECESFHALLELIAPVNQSEAIKLIATLKYSHRKVENYLASAYVKRSADEGDYIRDRMMNEWRKVVGISA
jgi:hypothetical protein